GRRSRSASPRDSPGTGERTGSRCESAFQTAQRLSCESRDASDRVRSRRCRSGSRGTASPRRRTGKHLRRAQRVRGSVRTSAKVSTTPARRSPAAMMSLRQYSLKHLGPVLDGLAEEARQDFDVRGWHNSDAVHTLTQCQGAGLKLRNHSAADGRLSNHAVDLRKVQPLLHGSVDILDSGDVGQEYQCVRAARYSHSRSHAVGIHVVVLAVGAQCDAGDNWNRTVLPQSFEPLRLDTTNVADKAEINFALALRSTHALKVSAAKSKRRLPGASDRRDQLLIQLAGQDHDSDVAGIGVGDAEPVDELRLASQFFQRACERSAAAVYNNDLVPVRGKARYRGCE